MAGKARVHELAKELGVSSKDVLARLNEQGEFVKSASSTVEAPVARRLRESFGGSKPAPAKVAPRAPQKPSGNALDAALDKAVGNGEATSAPAKPGAPRAVPAPAAPAPTAAVAEAPAPPAAPAPSAPAQAPGQPGMTPGPRPVIRCPSPRVARGSATIRSRRRNLRPAHTTSPRRPGPAHRPGQARHVRAALHPAACRPAPAARLDHRPARHVPARHDPAAADPAGPVAPARILAAVTIGAVAE